MQSARNDTFRCLLVAAGASSHSVQFIREQLDCAHARIAATKDKIDAARKELVLECRALVINKALPVCFALQELQLHAFATLAILDELLPARTRDLVTMHFKWELITAIKHFHDRIQAAQEMLIILNKGQL